MCPTKPFTVSEQSDLPCPLTKKVTGSQKSQDSFFADLMNNRELYTAYLNGTTFLKAHPRNDFQHLRD